MKFNKICFLPFFLLTVLIVDSCQSGSKKSGLKDKYEETKVSVGEMEKKNPIRFLSVSGKEKHNLIGQTVVKGTISSSAAVVTYKNIDVGISFFSKTGTLLEEDHETIYEALKPGSSIDFKSKYFAPKGTDNVQMKIGGADVSE